MVITHDGTVATPTNAGRYEVNLDGISVIVSAPEGSFDREVFLKASRVDDNEDVKRLLSKNLNIDTDSKETLTESEDKESENIEEYTNNVEDSVSEENFTDEGSLDSDVTEGEEYVDSTISLDIHFEDESGSEVEPLKQVYVNIKLDSGLIPKGINPEDVQIYHIKDDESISKVDDIALTKDKDDDSITTNFSTDSFSTFSLHWGSANSRFYVNVKYVDTNGNEITADPSKLELFKNNNNGVFGNDNDKITPRELDTGIVGMRYKYARVVMSNGTVVNNVLQIERETSLIKGLRYTVDGTNWVVFSSTEMRNLELVYEPESRTISNRRIRTDISKTVEDPDKDGIYDLTLKINNQTGSTSNRTNMDVLFLLDTTSSMSEGISGNGTDPKISSVYSVLRNVIRNNYFDSSKYNVNYALVGIDSDPHLYQNWTSNGNTLISKIPVSPNNVSRINYEKGFVKANEIFRNGRSDAQKVLIFITDGNPTYYTNHNTGWNEGHVINRYSTMAMLHGQFALYAIDLDYFFSIGLGNQGDYDKLKLLTNSNDSDSPVRGYKGITLPTPGVEVGASPYSAGSKNDFLNRMREIVNVLKNPRVSNVVLEDKLSQYAMIAKDPSGNPYPLEIEVLGPTGIHTGNYIATNMYRLFSTPRNSLADIVSSYNASTKTIRLEFPYAYTLETGYTYMIKAKIQTTQQANAIYSSTGHFQKNSNGSDVVGDPGTGSKSSNQKGFYSNDLATLTYKYKDKEIVETFKKPVIQPYIKPVPTGVSFKMTYAIIFISASIFSVLIFFFRRKRD
ncbi:vWA domain-containing protein [Lachnoanaerobaculum saburreum]|uniref:von Willebrand factor type A domain protein n=1 Tax=Lachnoanaerobaculum saburreum TaxID=467210 RepID=A0A133ZN62_9FIRM|nr:vWA domain-containing protein [Lachnoanaerobaculum saburreum]KXB56893.1 von Willebrand factor type A domain protein [Lachnoanaerobaculum saburreum]